MASVVCPGVPDEEVVALAVDQGRVLVTEDKDFGALAVVAKMAPLGVVRLSLPRFDPIKKASRLVAVLASEDPIGNILVVEPTRTRSHSIL